MERQAALNFIIGFVVGIAGGLIGLGGAELRLPYLVGVLGLAPRSAVAANLAVSLVTILAALPVRLATTSMGSLWADWAPVAGALMIGGVVAAYIGAGWLSQMPTDVLARLIGMLLAILGCIMLLEAVFPLVPQGLLAPLQAIRIAAGVGFGLIIGGISSLLGVAGGEVIIPTLVLGYGTPIIAAGTLSLCISLPTVIVGLARYWQLGMLQDGTLIRAVVAPLAAGAVVGAPLGGALLAYAPTALVKALLGALLVWSAWKVFARPGHDPPRSPDGLAAG